MAGGMAGLSSPSNKKFPTFEEFMAERNKKAETKARPQIDIDDLVKKIDAQIARLEEEERQEKANKDRMTSGTLTDEFNPFGNTDKKVLFEDDMDDKISDKTPEVPTFEEKTSTSPSTFEDLFGSKNDMEVRSPFMDDDKDIEVVEEAKEVPFVAKEDVVTQEPVASEPVQEVTPIVTTVPETQPQPTPQTTVSPNVNFQSMINENITNTQPVVQEPTVINTSVQQVVTQPTQVVTQPVQQVVVQTQQPTTVITQPSVPIKVDTQSKVIGNDDEYFDDFFE